MSIISDEYPKVGSIKIYFFISIAQPKWLYIKYRVSKRLSIRRSETTHQNDQKIKSKRKMKSLNWSEWFGPNLTIIKFWFQKTCSGPTIYYFSWLVLIEILKNVFIFGLKIPTTDPWWVHCMQFGLTGFNTPLRWVNKEELSFLTVHKIWPAETLHILYLVRKI